MCGGVSGAAVKQSKPIVADDFDYRDDNKSMASAARSIGDERTARHLERE